MEKKSTPQKTEITFETMPQAIAKVYEVVYLVSDQLIELKEKFEPKAPLELLTRNETSEKLKVDLSTLWNWQQKGILVPFGIGNRVYYRRSDIEAALIQLGEKRGGSKL
ncbi:MAG: helix-turn-helix domain-containing protein [Bacteroidota bacterium]|nr:helix-turn-helix domain-containing protein [Bacteroidota bacterium]